MFIRITSIFISIMFIYTCCIVIKNIFRYNIFRLDHGNLENQLEKQRRVNKQYKKEILELDNETYLELSAKKKLHLVKSGEKVYKFIE